MSNLTGVTNFFSTANEGFATTLSGGILTSATTIPLSSVAGLVDGSVFVGIIEPGLTNQQVFTGTVNLTGVNIQNVIWTRGTNVPHAAGVAVVDYVTGTDWNMMSTGIQKFANQNGKLIPTALYDANGNKTLGLPATASAVNYLQSDNATATNTPTLEGAGTDTNIGINFKTKGSDILAGLQYNGVQYRALPKDWTRALVATELFPTATTPAFTGWLTASGTGYAFPGYYATANLSPAATQNANIQYKLYLDAGSYTFYHYLMKGTSQGIIQFSTINEQGVVTYFTPTTDTYSTTGGWIRTSPSVTFGYGGYFTFSFTSVGKNASSTDYQLGYFGTQIVRTA